MLAPKARAETFSILGLLGLEDKADKNEPLVAPKLTPVKSDQGGIEMIVPDSWKTETTRAFDKLIFSYAFNNRQLDDYIVIKAQQYSLAGLLKEQNVTVQEGIKLANLWKDVLQPPLTADQMALGILQHCSPRANGEGNVREDQVVDVKLLESTEGEQGSGLFFHIRSIPPKPADDDPDAQKKGLPSRFWVVKAVLNNGVVSMGFVSAVEKHWQNIGSNSSDPVDGPYLDSIARSLRLSPPNVTKV